MAKLLQERLNVNVMVYEYTGFGYSDKVPRKNGVATTEAHIYADIKAAYTWLVNMGTKESDIIVMGRSFGSGPSVELVATQEVGGLVLISAFASVLRVASPWLRHTVRSFDMFVSFCLSFLFDFPRAMYSNRDFSVQCNVDKMSKVQCPVFSVHGKKDEIVPMRQAKLLLSKAKSQSYVPFWLPEAGHNDVAFCEWGELVLHFEEFFSNIEKGTLFGRYYRRNKFAF